MDTKDLIKDAIYYLRNIPTKDEKRTDDPVVDTTATKEKGFKTEHFDDVAGLTIPKGESATQVKHILSLLRAYVRNKDEDKPLSIAIFGPPGSGKSTFVKNISEKVKGMTLVKTVNLTQFNHSEELAETFKNALISMRGTSDVPVVFFDEFDTMRNGTPLGWLSWFLAPMEDGVMLAQGQELDVGKAVFIFAGGTAETLDEFSQRAKANSDTYRARKVPDFISRLRGAINIGGINGHGEDRIKQRAMALSYGLDGKQARALDKQNRLRPMLEHGYFVHGVRSLKTFSKAEQTGRRAAALPDVIRRQHFSRGEFDGLKVGISAGLQKDDGSQGLTVALTEKLLQSGATVAYAGAFFPKGTLDAILKKADQAPDDLINEPNSPPRIVNFLGNLRASNDKVSQLKKFESRVLETISPEELKELGAPSKGPFPAIPPGSKSYIPANHAAWAISLFRLRVRVMQDIGALVVCGGKDDGNSWGRMSGIAEEVMIALALGKPVYVLGGAGGAAASVGKLLGLHDAPVALNRFLKSERGDALLDLLNERKFDFRIPGVPDSPKDLDDVRDFLFSHGVCTKSWPKNGLSVDDNRALFAGALPKEIMSSVSLILQGLGSIDWKIDR